MLVVVGRWQAGFVTEVDVGSRVEEFELYFVEIMYGKQDLDEMERCDEKMLRRFINLERRMG
jgi:hypothetical protein